MRTLTETFAKVQTIESSDAYADKVGAELARVLQLTPVTRDEDGCLYPTPRYETLWGTKTACGLARTALRILFDEE